MRGALHEFLYNDPLEPRAVARTIPALLAYHAHVSLASRAQHSQWYSQQHRSELTRTLWIGRRAWPSPPALAGLTSSNPALSESFLEHSLFIDPPSDSAILWALDLALRSSAIDVVVAACPNISRTTTQRLSLAAQRFGTTALLLRSHGDYATPSYYATPSCAASRWTIAPTPSTHNAPSWRLSLAKLRGGLLMHGEWIVSMHAPDLFHASTQALWATQGRESVNAAAQGDSCRAPQLTRAHAFL